MIVEIDERMKDYYKILGVSKNRSEEEIRRHWIKLMQRYHPDHKGNGSLNEQRIREINEAYEILKHSSTRVEYDIRRKAYYRKKGKPYLRSLLVPISIFIVLLIMSTLSFRKSSAPPESKFVASEGNRTSERSDPNIIDKNTSRDRKDRTARTQKPEASVKPLKVVVKKGNKGLSKASREVKPSEDSRTKTVKAVPIRIGSKMASMSVSDAKPKPIEVASEEISLKSGISEREKGAENDWIDQVEEKDKKGKEVSGSKEPLQNELIPVEVAKPPEQEIRKIPATISAKKEKVDERDSIEPQKDQRIRIATEEEVKKFFTDYVDRYNRKDIDHFLSFFSVKAVQNHEDGFEKIQKMYTHFFRESRRLAYQLKDQKIGILSDHARVRASYEIEQVDRAGGVRLWRGKAEWVLEKEGWDLKISSLQYQHDRVR